QVVALRDDDVIVPAALLDRGLDFGGIADGADDLLLAILADDNLLATLSQDAAHALLVEDAGVARPGFHVRLIAVDDPIGGIDYFAAVLDARVGKPLAVARHESEGAAQLEVAR